MVSLHPAGHVRGSAQVRVQHQDVVWVATGDFKRAADPTCRPFEVVACDVLITEATFSLPVYRWVPGRETAEQIYRWWQSAPGVPSLLFCYAFGKTQRVLAELGRLTDRTVLLHGAAAPLTEVYRESGVPMVPTKKLSDYPVDKDLAGELIIAPPSAHRSRWMRRFKNPQTAFASGWMQLRGTRRRGGYERGFPLSDHADWNALIQTITECGARKVLLTHGDGGALTRYLTQVAGLQAAALSSLYEGDEE